MRSLLVITGATAAAVVLSSLAACADDPPQPVVPAPAVAVAPAPVVIAPAPAVVAAAPAVVAAPTTVAVVTPPIVTYRADLRPVAAKKQLLHSASNVGLCADVKGDNAAQHAHVRLWSCHGRENQRWDFGAGVAGAVQVGGIGGLCLTVTSAPSADGTMAELLTCNGSAAQEFRFYADGRIQELATSRCLQGGGGPSGSGIVLGACDATNAGQVWALGDH